MDTKTNNNSFKEILHLISTIFSWTLFTLLVICAGILLYYFVATKIFSTFGSKYEPKFSLYSIMSPSMTPNIQVYDVIVNVKVDKPEDIKIGDVITFISNSPETKGMTITHRVVSIIKSNDGNYSYQTKGDANPIEDTGVVEYNNIIGKVALKIPALGRLQVFIGSSTGLILIVLAFALVILLKALIRKIREYNEVPRVRGRIGTLLHKPLYLPYTISVTSPKDDETKSLKFLPITINKNTNNSNNNFAKVSNQNINKKKKKRRKNKNKIVNNNNNNINQKPIETKKIEINDIILPVEEPKEEIVEQPILKEKPKNNIENELPKFKIEDSTNDIDIDLPDLK